MDSLDITPIIFTLIPIIAVGSIFFIIISSTLDTNEQMNISDNIANINNSIQTNQTNQTYNPNTDVVYNTSDINLDETLTDDVMDTLDEGFHDMYDVDISQNNEPEFKTTLDLTI